MYKKIFVCLVLNASLYCMEEKQLKELKKSYINNYRVVNDEQKDALRTHAPQALQDWFAQVQKGNTVPAILYGEFKDKALVAQILARDAYYLLSCVIHLKDIRKQLTYREFKKCYLDTTNEKVCIIADNTGHFQEEDSLNALIDSCKKRKNLHLLVIDDQPHKNMSPQLFGKFKTIKFSNLKN